MYRNLSSLFERLDVEPHISHYSHREGAIARLVEQGLCIGIVAEIEGLEKYNVRIIHPQRLTGGQHIYLTRHRTRMITQAAQQLQSRILRQIRYR